MKKSFLILAALMLNLFSSAPSALAIPETDYAAEYTAKVVPFMKENARAFTFKSFDGLDLSAVHFVHPDSKGTIVILPGRSEPWVKYAEVFYDLYQQGYSIYSYDHRGQGLSPHLSAWNPQIGHVVRFQHYVNDLNAFVNHVVVPAQASGEKLFLLAHSMGGAIATAYLEQFKSPFASTVLSAPMLQINTKPYPEPIAITIVALAKTFGFGNRYAIGKTDYDFNLPFENNIVTRSRARFEMTNDVYRANPAALIGGPSNRWVYESIKATHSIRAAAFAIHTPVLLLQAAQDQLVILNGQNTACAATEDCHLVSMADSQHEILMERDAIRDHALSLIVDFFH
jgi:lysophospholipase